MDNEIDTSELHTAFLNAVKDTFEEMAFLEVLLDQDKESEANLNNLIALDICAPFSGTIVIHIPEELKDIVAQNIHGQEADELSKLQKEDCLLEMLNVIAGNFLNYYFGKDIKYTVGLPTVLDGRLENTENCFNMDFSAEKLPFQITLCYKKN